MSSYPVPPPSYLPLSLTIKYTIEVGRSAPTDSTWADENPAELTVSSSLNRMFSLIEALAQGGPVNHGQMNSRTRILPGSATSLVLSCPYNAVCSSS